MNLTHFQDNSFDIEKPRRRRAADFRNITPGSSRITNSPKVLLLQRH